MKNGCLFVGNTEQIINHKEIGYDFEKLFFYRKVKDISECDAGIK
jgi:chemotaxis protein methyltransferase CheR